MLYIIPCLPQSVNRHSEKIIETDISTIKVSWICQTTLENDVFSKKFSKVRENSGVVIKSHGCRLTGVVRSRGQESYGGGREGTYAGGENTENKRKKSAVCYCVSGKARRAGKNVCHEEIGKAWVRLRLYRIRLRFFLRLLLKEQRGC